MDIILSGERNDRQPIQPFETPATVTATPFDSVLIGRTPSSIFFFCFFSHTCTLPPIHTINPPIHTLNPPIHTINPAIHTVNPPLYTLNTF